MAAGRLPEGVPDVDYVPLFALLGLAAGGWPLAKPEHFNPANWP
jgi:hypothetical protein